MPFIENSAAPDIQAFPALLRIFYHLFFEDADQMADEYDKLVGAWAKEIANSAFGNWVAHMSVILQICLSSGTFPTYVLREDGSYEGAVIHGTIGIRVVGGVTCYSKRDDEFVRATGVFQSHMLALREILKLLGRDDVDESQVKSMRFLHSIITGPGEVGGNVRNEIAVQIEKLNFKETPTPVTPETMCHTMTLLTMPDEPIAMDTFLDASAVFSLDRTTLVLARYGSTVPTFSYGGPDVGRFCQVEGKGVTVAYEAQAPANLQMKRIALRAAVQSYNFMMATGTIRSDLKRRIQGTRAFLKIDNQRIWDHFGRCVEKSVIRKGTATQRFIGEGEPGPSANKRRKAIDFI